MKKVKERDAKFGTAIKNSIVDFFYGINVFLHNKIFSKLKRKDFASNTKSRRNELIFIACVLVFPLTVFCVFYIGVNFNSILLAFQDYNYETFKYEWVGINQFKEFFKTVRTEPFMSYSLKNSFSLLGLTLLINLPFQVLNAYYVYKKKLMHKFFKVILFLPSVLSNVVMVTIFKYFVDYGVKDLYRLLDLGTAPQLISGLDNGFKMILLFTFWSSFGGNIILFVGVMTRIPATVVEAAEIDGITPVKEFFYITLPLVFPTIVVYIISAISTFFTNQGSLYAFYGVNARTEHYTFGYYYFTQVLGEAGVGKYPMVAAAGLIFTLIIAPITLILRRIMTKLFPAVEF